MSDESKVVRSEQSLIVDSLVHVTDDGLWFNTNCDASLKGLLDHMQKYGVRKAVLSGVPGYDSSDRLLSICNENPGLFYPVPVMNKAGAQETSNTLKHLKLKGVKAVKIHPRFSGITQVTDPWLERTIQLCEEEEMVMFLCTVFTGIEANRESIPKTLGSFCRNYPKLRFVFLHGGYVDLLHTSEEIRPYENALLDLSATLTRFYDSSLGLDIKFLMRTFDRRLSIGTDFPEGTYGDVFRALEYLGYERKSVLKEPFMGMNLLRFLGEA